MACVLLFMLHKGGIGFLARLCFTTKLVRGEISLDLHWNGLGFTSQKNLL